MRNRSLKHTGQDFHIVMGMGAKTIMRCDQVIINYTQGADTHEFWIIPATKGEAVFRLKPAHFYMTAVVTGV